MSRWIKKGDNVLILAGNEKGKRGEVIRRAGERVVVQGINIRKRHVKKRTKTAPGGIIEREMPLHISNVSLCDSEGKVINLQVRVNKEGKKELFYLDGKKDVLHRAIG